MDSIEIKRARKTDNQFNVKMNITHGKLLALLEAVRKHNSPVGVDLHDLLLAAVDKDPDVLANLGIFQRVRPEPYSGGPLQPGTDQSLRGEVLPEDPEPFDPR